MSLCDDVVVVAAAADVAGAEAAAAEGAAAALDVDAAAAEAEVADGPVAVAHTHPPTDSSPVVAAAAALQTQAQHPTPMAVAFAVDPDSAHHTRDTSRTAEAGRTDYAEVALGPVGASRMALAAHTAQAGVVGKVDEAAAIPSVHDTMRNSRKVLAARELGVVRSGVGSRLGKMWMGEGQGWRIVGAGARVQAVVVDLVGAVAGADPFADDAAGHSTHTGERYEEAVGAVGCTSPSYNRNAQVAVA